MSFTGIYQFGNITTKSGQVINFEDIKTDSDGKMSQRTYNFIQKELCMDTLELSEEGQKEEKQVTDFEFVLWSKEVQMQEAFENICTQVASDFIGDNAKYSSQIIKGLRQFLKDFLEENSADPKKMIEMADKFEEELLVKYNKMKEELIGTSGKDYEKVQQEWDKYVSDFEKNIAKAGSIDEFVKLNREYLKEHGEYIQKMLACKDIDSQKRTELIQASKADLEQYTNFSQLSAEGRNMQSITNQFIKDLEENCPGWKDLLDNPIISNPDSYMLQFYYSYRDNPSSLKKSMSAEYYEHINQKYEILVGEYKKHVESGEITPDETVKYEKEQNP